MWLFSIHDFYSIVQKGEVFYVRSKEKHVLENWFLVCRRFKTSVSTAADGGPEKMRW